ncbi:TROVE domain-containing protein [Mycolicibacterium fortuitum]|uniref:TROVE domain-containing protein n=1 Tax=Mycolicibacterium fortuitum TaxID=1766 RepID=UPI0007EB4119|nr:TROVE domain-containing protein [Mycolicibacterium fortuitum]OBF77159.1 RNA-binding protein [Mycolicibacterium fortuitum]
MDVLATVSTRRTPQTEKADPRQIRNAAGGYTFAVDDWARVHRFLTLGVDGGTYYTGAAELAKDNAEVILRAAATDPIELVRRIVEVSTAGRAPKQNPALFALAIAAAADDVDGRRAALAALPQVARTGTHLFLFARYVEQFRGWGPALAKGVARWYTDRNVDKLAYQVVKYRQREGWTHRDLLRLSHPVTVEPERRALFDFVTRGSLGAVPEALDPGEVRVGLPAIIEDFTAAQNSTSIHDWVDLIGRGNGLSWEMLPDAALGHAKVWEALIDQGIPQTALMRQLPRLTRLGLAVGDTGRTIAAQLQDPVRLKTGRVHPINVLVAQRTYTSGQSARGESTWTPVSKISDALDAAFYNAYGAVEPSGKRILLALDVSGSMTAPVSGLPLSCRESSAALAMVTAGTEPNHDIVGFTGRHGNNGYGAYVTSTALTELDISPRRRLDDVCRYVGGLPMGMTDCALPFTWAAEQKRVYDAVVVLTDNESWAGPVHVHQALRRYREQINPEARLIVASMTARPNTVADPKDPLSLDVSGFDTTVPQVISDFAAGRI